MLIVDDEPAVREGCREVAEGLGFRVSVADSAPAAYRILEAESIDLCLLDLRLPGAGGIEVLQELRRRRPEAEVVVITGYATVQSAVEAMKLGACDYVAKPFHAEELRLLLERVARQIRLSTENRLLREKVRNRRGFAGMVGHSREMEKLYRIISKVASSSHPVLIQGESGTGKELVARSIHFSGSYRDKPFIPVDCGALVPTLIESELF
ncbi:MAG TPA: response regulator, partial [Terriglobales bacterium]|nr:response regulator [Terriglobales bacterium]